MQVRLRRTAFLLTFASAVWIAIAGCGDDDDGSAAPDAGFEASTIDAASQDTGLDSRSPELTGSACKTASDCYGTLDAASLKGTATCIDKVTNGYCTHTCTTDADCCAVEGECRTGFKQVCASFENKNEKYCFLSCEAADIAAAPDGGGVDAGADDLYCSKNVSADFGCRSTGGGSENRKVCLPTGAPDDGGKPNDASDAADAADADGG